MPPVELDFEALAREIHEYYRDKHGNSPPYDALPEFLKADNREAAMRIGKVLAMAGLSLVPRNEPAWTPEQQDYIARLIAKNLALLAETEHDYWVEARLRQGWVKAARRCADKVESHLLVDYSEFKTAVAKKQELDGPAIHKSGVNQGLPMSLDEEVEAEKNKDRDAVTNYVAIIAKTQYHIVEEV